MISWGGGGVLVFYARSYTKLLFSSSQLHITGGHALAVIFDIKMRHIAIECDDRIVESCTYVAMHVCQF